MRTKSSFYRRPLYKQNALTCVNNFHFFPANMTTQKKIITVFGATGAQGGGLVRAILNDPASEFSVRAVTRNIYSEKALALHQLGAEVVMADLDDTESIKQALRGAYGAFFVTFYWEHISAEKEKAQIHNLANAAKEEGLQHIIWSTLEDTRNWIPLTDNRMPTLQDKYKVPHFDAKGESDQYFIDLNLPVTFLKASFYWENFIYFGMGPKKDESGKWVLTLPMGDKKLPGIAAEDIGRCAYGIFKNGPSFIGKTIGIAGEHLTGQEMAAAMAKATGQEIIYNSISPATFRSFGFPGADDVGNMFQFYQEFNISLLNNRNVEITSEINPSLQSFDQWLSENAQRIISN